MAKSPKLDIGIAVGAMTPNIRANARSFVMQNGMFTAVVVMNFGIELSVSTHSHA